MMSYSPSTNSKIGSLVLQGTADGDAVASGPPALVRFAITEPIEATSPLSKASRALSEATSPLSEASSALCEVITASWDETWAASDEKPAARSRLEVLAGEAAEETAGEAAEEAAGEAAEGTVGETAGERAEEVTGETEAVTGLSRGCKTPALVRPVRATRARSKCIKKAMVSIFSAVSGRSTTAWWRISRLIGSFVSVRRVRMR